MDFRVNSDQLNIIFMILSVIVAYCVPIELVLLSYAFLGPAHYLTQISWMHDRQYFVGSKAFPYIFVALGLLYTVLIYTSVADVTIYADILFTALALAGSLLLQKSWPWRAALFFFLFFLYLCLSMLSFEVAMAVALLLPTVIHIFVFTWFFMVGGAMRSPSPSSILACVLLPLCGLVFFVWAPEPIIYSRPFVQQNLMFFSPVIDYLAVLVQRIGVAGEPLSIMGFLSFAYTYHYLNWFSKVNVIKWNQISDRRLAVIVILYCMSVGLYFYDYKAGFMALIFFKHVACTV